MNSNLLFKTKATLQEIKNHELLPEYSALISDISSSGRLFGVTLKITDQMNTGMIFDKDSLPAHSNRFNPLQGLPEGIEYVMAMLVAMSGIEITPSVNSKATEALLAAATHKAEITILDAVEAFDLEPDLRGFGAALRKTALPGHFEKYFIKPQA